METEAQRQEIFNAVCSMQSFRRHMSHPKLQNWFAWNGCSHEQQPEFYGSKLIFESVLDKESSDPQAERFSISASTDPRAELQRILKSGGGIELAYRLMKDGLQQHIKVQYYAEKASAAWTWPTRCGACLPASAPASTFMFLKLTLLFQ